MIVESDYRLPHAEQLKQEQPKADPATLEYLEVLPFRPIGVEW